MHHVPKLNKDQKLEKWSLGVRGGKLPTSNCIATEARRGGKGERGEQGRGRGRGRGSETPRAEEPGGNEEKREMGGERGKHHNMTLHRINCTPSTVHSSPFSVIKKRAS